MAVPTECLSGDVSSLFVTLSPLDATAFVDGPTVVRGVLLPAIPGVEINRQKETGY